MDAPASILQLGDPRLREVAAPVDDVHDPLHRAGARRLVQTLVAFRAAHGFGRGIAAPQIGVMRRYVALCLGGEPFVIANPEVTWRSRATFTMWDDCMSFPSLLVRVRRHRSISVRYTNEAGERRDWPHLDQATSELLQHELDHLDGVLAIDRADGEGAIIDRAAFAAAPAAYARQVDYVIVA